MSISSYKPAEPPAPINNLISQLFRNRIHKKIPVDRTDFNSSLPLELNSLRKEYSQMSQRSSFSEPKDTQDQVLKESSLKIEPCMKKKIIQKQISRRKGLEFSRKIHHKYSSYLVNFMHKSNLNLINRQIPPNLSVLETVDEGDFILNDNGTLYQRKDHPHYSNVIKLHQLPSNETDCMFINPPQKMRPQELIFQIQDKCVLKLKQIYYFVTLLFRKSIQFCKKMKNVKYSSQQPRQNQNHDFQTIAKEVNLHFRTTKLLYDILNQFYGLEREMIKGEDGKIKASKQIKESLKSLLENYKVNESIHTPHSQLFISLRQLRQILHQQVIAEENQQSDDE